MAPYSAYGRKKRQPRPCCCPSRPQAAWGGVNPAAPIRWVERRRRARPGPGGTIASHTPRRLRRWAFGSASRVSLAGCRACLWRSQRGETGPLQPIRCVRWRIHGINGSWFDENCPRPLGWRAQPSKCGQSLGTVALQGWAGRRLGPWRWWEEEARGDTRAPIPDSPTFRCDASWRHPGYDAGANDCGPSSRRFGAGQAGGLESLGTSASDSPGECARIPS